MKTDAMKTLPVAALLAAVLLGILAACTSPETKPKRERDYMSRTRFNRNLEIETPTFEEGYEEETPVAEESLEEPPPADPDPVVKEEEDAPPPPEEETREEEKIVDPVKRKEEVKKVAAADKKAALETMGGGELNPWGDESIADMENLRARKAGQALADLDLEASFPVEDEIELGTGVAARVIHETPELKDERLWRYVTFVGLSLLEQIRRDEGNLYTFYFIVLDSPKVNAFAVPGGFIFINKGAIDVCENEAELASILAHEISHVTLRHGVRSLDKSKYHIMMKTAVNEMHESFAREWPKDRNTPEWNKALEKELDEIGDEFYARSLAPFNRDLEREADRQGLLFLSRAGYNPRAAVTVMERMVERSPGGDDRTQAFSSHPHPKERKETMNEIIRQQKLPTTGRLNERRFRTYTGR